jgi:hypothetical protein
MSYIQTFGGGTVQSSNTSYSPYDLTAGNLVLFWPSQFQDTPNVVYDFMNITSGVGGRTLRLPDATQTSVGTSFVINNIGGQSIQILNGSSVAIVTINGGAIFEFYLTSNTTVGGLYSTVPFGGGAAGVISLTSVQPPSGITINQNATTGAIVQTFTLNSDLLALENLATTGYSVRTAPSTWATRSFVTGANMVITNSDGVAGNTTIALSPALNGLTAITVGNINLTNNVISGTQLNQNIVITPAGTGEIQSSGNINIQSANQLKFFNAANTFYTGLIGGNAAGNTTYTLPTTFPAANGYVLSSTTAGITSWISAVTNPGATTVNAIAKYSNTVGQITNSGVLIDNANNITGANSVTAGNIQLGVVGGPTNISTVGGGAITVLGPTVVFNNSIQLFANGGASSFIAFYDGAQTNSITFKAQNAAMGASLGYTLPNAGPTISRQFLSSTIPAGGISTMSWVTPSVIQSVRTVSNVATSTNSIIPLDNTVPQSNEGAQLITATLTPVSTGTLLVEFYCPIFRIANNVGAAQYAIFTLFQNGNNNALAAEVIYVDTVNTNSSDTAYLKYIFTPAVQNIPITFSINYGSNAGLTLALLTAGNVPATLGGIPQLSLTVTEISP